MIAPAELLANALNAVSIGLAGRRNVHTWWTGIVGCVLFAWVFNQARLYADALLQGFFIATSALGWWRWGRGEAGAELPVRRSPPRRLALQAAAGLLVAGSYAAALWRFTDAAAPLADSLVLVSSVLGQLLLVEKRIESWYCWLAANTIAVPLYASRELYLTAALYCAFWLNALLSLRHWRAQLPERREIQA
jgi:nicotinamide mononucleotide transporter